MRRDTFQIPLRWRNLELFSISQGEELGHQRPLLVRGVLVLLFHPVSTWSKNWMNQSLSLENGKKNKGILIHF